MQQFSEISRAEEDVSFDGLKVIHQVILIKEDVQQPFTRDLVRHIDCGFEPGDVVVSQDLQTNKRCQPHEGRMQRECQSPLRTSANCASVASHPLSRQP